MRTTIDIPDHLLKKAKLQAVKEGISLKELFTRSLERELAELDSPLTPWNILKGMGSSEDLAPEDSGFEGYQLPLEELSELNVPDE